MIDRFLRALSSEQKLAIAVCKSVSATLSLIASSIIIYNIHLRYKSQSNSTVVSGRLRSTKNDGKVTTYHRMLLSISILDVIHSTSNAFSTSLVPSYTNSTFAIGNTATCTLQGALQQLTTTIVIYLAMLNTYFMFKIRYNVADAVIKSKYEIWFHAVPILFFVVSVIIGLSLGIFGPLLLPELGCWLDSYCIATKTCTRSGPIFYNHLDWWAWSFGYIWLFVGVLIMSINAVLIYTAIRHQERRNEKYLATTLLHHSEAFTNRSVSSSLEKSIIFSKKAVIRVNDNEGKPCGNGPDYDATLLRSGRQPEEAKVELTGIDETEEATESGELPEAAVDGNSNNNNQKTDDDDDDVHTSTRIPRSTSLRRTSMLSHSYDQQQAQNQKSSKNSRVAAVQGTLYITSALFTAFWIFMPWLGYKLQVGSGWRFFFAMMTNIATPSQGIFNLLLFVRIYYLRLRETNPDWSRWKCFKTCLFSPSD